MVSEDSDRSRDRPFLLIAWLIAHGDEHLSDCRSSRIPDRYRIARDGAPEDAPGVPAFGRISLRQRSTLGPL